MSLQRIDSNNLIFNPKAQLPLERNKEFTQVILANKARPTFIQALATSVALVFAAVIVCLSSPVLKVAGVPLMAVLKNIGSEISHVWSKYSGISDKQLLPVERSIRDALDGSDQSRDLRALRKNFMKEYHPHRIMSELEGFGSQKVNPWDLNIGLLNKTYQIPRLLEQDCDRFPMIVTIYQGKSEGNIVMSKETFEDLSSKISYETPDRDKILQRKSLEVMLKGLFDCSSLSNADEIDPNLLCLFTQSAPCTDINSFCAVLPSSIPALENLEFKKEDLRADVYDVSPNQMEIVYTGSISISEKQEDEKTQIGSLNYQMTLVLKKEGGKWVDVSYGASPTDGRVLQLNGRPPMAV